MKLVNPAHRGPLVLLAFALFVTPAAGQELTPRANWPGPEGLNVFTVGYVYTDGDVLIDPSIPVDDVKARTSAVSLGYYRIFGLAGRTATVTAVLPAASSKFESEGELERTLEASGLADLQLRLGINLLGGAVMTPREFQAYRKEPPRNVLGVSLKVQVPTGEFNPDRIANVGTSRWSLKPEVGYVRHLGKTNRWAMEFAFGVWFYGQNKNFINGKLQQDPILGPEIHLVRRISPGEWLAFDWNYYQGGQTTVAGIVKDNSQRNSRIGVTYNYPIKHHVIRVSLSNSLSVTTGGDYWSGLLSYSYAWNSGAQR